MENSQWTQRYGPTALVTGASSGIGEQFARLLAQRGFDLVLTARREPLLLAIKEELEREFGISVTCIVCDLCDPDQVGHLTQEVLRLDIGLVISNAGYGVAKGAYLDIPPDALEAMYRANSLAPARIARALLPVMVAQRRGGFIFTGSIEGDAVFPWSTAYAASKAFLHSLVQGLWYEVRDSGVDVLLLAPGATDTEAPLKQGISRDQLVGIMSPAVVAEQALAHLGVAPHFTPGLSNRLFIGLLRLLPRKWSIALSGYGMQRAIGKSRSA
ncbi:MAG: SDR family NAD(P)-dependent oxidoreductase [Halioglobus sp.]|nr:SDR family NAD(P)-dependent oxidoreductase [Halioglobus sp.]